MVAEFLQDNVAGDAADKAIFPLLQFCNQLSADVSNNIFYKN